MKGFLQPPDLGPPPLFKKGVAYTNEEVMNMQTLEIERLGEIIKTAYRHLKVDGPNTGAVNAILLKYYDGRKS